MLIVFEGGDRCGKTTQCNLLLEHLQMKGRQAIYIKYPGNAIKVLDSHLLCRSRQHCHGTLD